jgi:hypothetical protein
MAREDNLIPYTEGGHKLTREEQVAGGIASGKARREKKLMKEVLESMLDVVPKKKNPNNYSYRDMATLGLIKGAVNGNSNNYRTILEVLGELNVAENEQKDRELSKVEELLSKIEKEANK